MKQRAKENLAYGLSLGAATVLSLGGWALGFAFRNDGTVWRALLGGALVLLLVMGVINCMRLFFLREKSRKMTARQIIDRGLEYKKQIDSDLESWEKSLNKKIFFSRLWIFVVALLILLVCFSFGKLMKEDEGDLAGAIFVAILCAFLLSGCIALLLRPGDPELPEKRFELIPAAYPRLFSLLDRASKKAGCRKRVRAFFSDDGFSVCERSREIFVYINASEFALLTQNELYSVLIHEFAHVKNADTAKLRRYRRICEKLALPENNIFGGIVCFAQILFFSYYSEIISFRFEIIRDYDSRRQETLADAFVKENDLCKPYIDATAKAALFSLYDQSAVPEINFEIYASETPVEDYYEKKLAVFKQYLIKNGELWNYILRHEIPARVDSHPTFRMRMEHMGVSDYDYTTVETDAVYMEEQEKALWTADQLLKRYSEEYKSMHERCLELKEKMQSFDEAEIGSMSVASLVDYLDLFYGVDNDRALRIAEKIEELQPDSSAAAFYKGMILSERGDEACVSLLYRAAEEMDFAGAAMESIGRFALKMGRQDILDEYRARTAGVMQNLMDGAKSVGVTGRDAFVPCDIPEEFFAPFLEGLVEEGKGEILRVYAAKKQNPVGGKDGYFYAIELTPLSEKSPEGNKMREELWQALYRYIQNGGLPEKYRLFSVFDLSQAKKTVRRMKKAVPDCKVYDAEEFRNA